MKLSKPPVRQSGRATLREVADLAGVSETTASLVLTSKAEIRRISEKTHQRVKAAAEQLNYAPNLLVRSLRQGRTHIISFYNGFRQREASDLYMDKLSSSVEYAGGKYGYDVLVHCNFTRRPNEIYQFLNGGLADGVLLFAPASDDPLLPLLRRSNLPVVLLNSRDPDQVFPSIADDSVQGMRLIAGELHRLGHRRIAACSGRGPEIRDASYRVEMLRTFLAELGLELPEKQVLSHGPGFKERLKSLVTSPLPPTALFCWHDRLAYEVLDALEEFGVSIPHDLSVVGYDGLRWPAATPHIVASARVDLELFAKEGISLLDQYIRGYEGPTIENVLPVSFIAGTTLGPAAKSHCTEKT